MDFDWESSPALQTGVTTREVEEAFEDPFSIRIMPEEGAGAGGNRYFLLGRSVTGKGLFCVFWTDGKRYRVIQARAMTEPEEGFYDRKNSDPSS